MSRPRPSVDTNINPAEVPLPPQTPGAIERPQSPPTTPSIKKAPQSPVPGPDANSYGELERYLWDRQALARALKPSQPITINFIDDPSSDDIHQNSSTLAIDPDILGHHSTVFVENLFHGTPITLPIADKIPMACFIYWTRYHEIPFQYWTWEEINDDIPKEYPRREVDMHETNPFPGHQLVDLYIFGSKIGAPAFQNMVMGHLIKCVDAAENILYLVDKVEEATANDERVELLGAMISYKAWFLLHQGKMDRFAELFGLLHPLTFGRNSARLFEAYGGNREDDEWSLDVERAGIWEFMLEFMVEVDNRATHVPL